MAVATHVAVMHRGRLEQVGTPEDLYRRPQTDVVARFIGRGRTLPVEVLASADGLCTLDLAGTVLKVAGHAPPGPGWLCFHASDLARAPQRGQLAGQLAGEVVNQIFQNGVYASELAPLGIDVETLSLALPERLAPGTRVEVRLSGGWVIPRRPSAAPALAGGPPATARSPT